MYAKVVLGLPVEGPFDYIVSQKDYKKIKSGVRVRINFCNQEKIGYVVGLSKKTKIKNLKPVLEVIDDLPVLDRNMLLLTKELSDYYCCSWGEAIETALPLALRKGKKINADSRRFLNEQNLRISALDLRKPSTCAQLRPKSTLKDDIVLIYDLDGWARWEIYLKEIKETVGNNKSVIVLLPDIDSVLRAKEIINLNLGILPAILYRRKMAELAEWLKIKEGKFNVVMGVRSSIFAPVNNLGLIIIDEEQNSAYKQDQVPHYNAKEIAFLRTKIDKAKIILGSSAPSLETFYLAQKNIIQYIFIPRKRNFPEIKIVDTGYISHKEKGLFSRYLLDTIISVLNMQGKALLFLNRKGFSTYVWCRYCGQVLSCPRCNINLVYHFKDNRLNCHYCNFKIEPPKICPYCNCAYIRYSGTGTEKIESELSRLFPQAKIRHLDKQKEININAADIFISRQSIIKKTDFNFDLIGVLSIENSLNRIDFRASEKTFALLSGLLGLTDKRLIIQTNLPRHHCFSSLKNKDLNLFYEEELKQRKELQFPPYRHITLVKLRGEKEERVKKVSCELFERLKKCNKDKGMRILSVNPNQPSKLRDKFYWQILISSGSPKKISKFLKLHLKDFSPSGIIVTVDVDPL